MSSSDRRPVIVGVGQVIQRVADPADAQEPLALMAQACERAASDAGAPALLQRADSIRIPHGLWEYANPCHWLAQRFGAQPTETALGKVSGTTVQNFVHDAAEAIQRGERDAVLVVGGEAEHTKRRMKRADRPRAWSDAAGPPVTHDLTQRFDFRESADFNAGIRNPTMVFALFEVALRHRLGRSVAEHQRAIAELWASFAAVASANPNAWIRDAPSAEFLATRGEDNRMVVAPYSKYLIANMVVDQAAAVILCSESTARSLGVAEDRWVYPHLATHSTEEPELSFRDDLAFERPMEIAARRLFEAAGLGPDALGPVDLYSCFPSAVQLAAEALGLAPDRPRTVTGGLTFAGGPFNSYVLHSLATTVERLRAEPGVPGLVSSVGGFMSYHAFGLYGAHPPASPFRRIDVRAEVADLPTRELASEFAGPVAVETCAVTYGPEAPDHAIVASRTPAGARVWSRCDDAASLAALAGEDPCGRPGQVRAGGVFELA